MKYDYLGEKLERIVKEAKRLVDSGEFKGCSPTCISCLVAKARTNDDKVQYGIGFDSSEDVAMLDAKGVLLATPQFKDWESR